MNVGVLVQRLTAERHGPRRRHVRRMWSLDNLPLPRVFMHGPKWQRYFDVQEVPIATLDPVAAQYHRPGRKLLIFSLESEVRERVQDEIRPGVFAQWSDPREVIGLGGEG